MEILTRREGVSTKSQNSLESMPSLISPILQYFCKIDSGLGTVVIFDVRASLKMGPFFRSIVPLCWDMFFFCKNVENRSVALNKDQIFLLVFVDFSVLSLLTNQFYCFSDMISIVSVSFYFFLN